MARSGRGFPLRPVTSAHVRVAPAGATYTDSAAGTVTFAGSSTDLATGANTCTGALTFAGTRSDARIAADTATGAVTLAGALTDARITADTAAGVVSVTGTRSDARIATDTPLGTVTVAGSSTSDDTGAVAGGVTFAGEDTDALVGDDSPVGAITLDGTNGAEPVVTPTPGGRGGKGLSSPVPQHWKFDPWEFTDYVDAPAGVLAFWGSMTSKTTIDEADDETALLLALLT